MSPSKARPRSAWLAAAGFLVAALVWIAAAQPAQAAFSTGKCAGDDITGRGASFARDAHQIFNFYFRNIFCSGTPGQGTINANYEAQGSGAGRLSMKVRNDTPRFGMTDEPPTPREVQQMNTGVGNGDPATDNSNPNDDGEIHVVPAAVGAVAPIVHFPNNCDPTLLPAAARAPQVTLNNVADVSIRVRFTKTQWEGIWGDEAGFRKWTEVFPDLAADSDCDVDITRVVRFDESGTSYAFKDYLNTINGGRGWLTTFGSGANGTREWPGATFGTRTDCSGSPNGPGGGATENTDRLTSGCSNGNGALVNTVKSTNGSIGYSDISTARTTGALAVTPGQTPNTYWTQLQNGSGEFTEPTFDAGGYRTDGGRGANCLSTQFSNVPTDTFDNWVPVSGVNSPTGYGICTLTYGLVFDDNATVWGNSSSEESKARTVKDYWNSVLSDGSQGLLFGQDYAPLPAQILAISRAGIDEVDWDKASNPPPPPTCPPDCPPPPPECGPDHPELCPPPPPPSNKISLQRTKIDSKKGTATVQVRLPGAGRAELVGKSKKPKMTVGSTVLNANASGTYGMTLKPSNKAKQVLKKKGKLKVQITVSFTPTGGEAGDPKTTDATLKLAKKKKK